MEIASLMVQGAIALLLVVAVGQLRKVRKAQERHDKAQSRTRRSLVRNREALAAVAAYARAQQPQSASEAETVVMATVDPQQDAVTQVLELDQDPVAVAERFPSGGEYLPADPVPEVTDDGPTPLYTEAAGRLPDVAALLELLADEPPEGEPPLYAAVDQVQEPQPEDEPGDGREDADGDGDPPTPPAEPEPQPALLAVDGGDAVRRYWWPESTPVRPLPAVSPSDRLASPGWIRHRVAEVKAMILHEPPFEVQRRVAAVAEAVRGGRHRAPSIVATVRDEVKAWWEQARGDSSNPWTDADLAKLATIGGGR